MKPFPNALKCESDARWSLHRVSDLIADQVEQLAGSGPAAESRRVALLELSKRLSREALSPTPPGAS